MLLKVLQLAVISSFFIGCAKEKPYKEQYGKEANVSKESLPNCTLEDPCLWVPSVANTPKDVPASRPYSMGSAKLVVTRELEDKYQILEIEKDNRFSDNLNNFSPVAHFELKRIDYRCKKDSLDKCSNVEEVDEEKHWSKKRFVQIESIKIDEVNTLPIQLSDTLSNSSCFKPGTAEFTGGDDKLIDVSPSAMNFKLKIPYSAKAGCVPLRELSDLKNLNFFVDYTYSLIKLSDYVDKNYVPLEYPREDEAKFGLFKSEQKTLSADNRDDILGRRSYLANRWSPNRKEIVYYLNEDFYLPEMKAVLQSTIKAIQTVNISLAKSGAKFKIVLKNGTGKNPGDLRNNFLLLVKDPQASGVIGYGPSIANPLTGEIIHARTVMFYGTIQKFLTRAYDERVDLLNAQADKGEAPGANLNTSHQGHGSTSSGINTDRYVLLRNYTPKSFDEIVKELDFMRLKEASVKHYSNLRNLDKVDFHGHDFHGEDMHKHLESHMHEIQSLSERTFYHASQFNFANAVGASEKCLISYNDSISGKKKYYKWEVLAKFADDELKKEVIDCLMPNVWVPTLVHEFGHNLGLRHNFYGSNDKANYFSSKARKDRGVNHPVNYSSIMDYAYSTVNELSVMGAYDEAVLGYAYGGQVEIMTSGGPAVIKIDGNIKDFPIRSLCKEVDGLEIFSVSCNANNIQQMIAALSGSDDEDFKKLGSSIAKSLTQRESYIENIKPYKYCSDEHVNTRIDCNRFDEGTSYEEIAKHYVNDYKKRYKQSNFRGVRRSFSSRNGDWSYFIGRLLSLYNTKRFFDIYDQFKFLGRFDGVDLTKPESELSSSEKNLFDIKKASDLSFDHLMSVLETPSYHCATHPGIKGVPLTKKDFDPNKVMKVAPFSVMSKGTQLEEFGITFDIENGCEILTHFYQPKAKTGDKIVKFLSVGKYLNNSQNLSKSSDFSGEIDDLGDQSQIDVRGIWFDKLAAAYLLTSRVQVASSFGSASDGSYIDYPEYSKRFMKYMNGVIDNKFTGTFSVRENENELGDIKASIDLSKGTKVNKSYSWIVNYIFDLDDTQTDLKSALMKVLKVNFRKSRQGSRSFGPSETYDDFNVAKLNLRRDVNEYNYDEKVVFKRGEMGALEDANFGVYSYNRVAMKLVEKVNFLKMLNEKKYLENDDFKKMLKDLSQVAARKAQFGKLYDDYVENLIGQLKDENLKDLISENLEMVESLSVGILTMENLRVSFLALSEKGTSKLYQLFN